MLRLAMTISCCGALSPALASAEPPRLICEGARAALTNWSIDQMCQFDAAGKTLGPFDQATDFQHGRAVVRSGEETYIIGVGGERLSGDNLSDLCGLDVTEDGSYLKMTDAGCAIAKLDAELPELPDGLRPDPPRIVAGFVAVRSTDGKYGVADTDGKIRIPASYEAVQLGDGSAFAGLTPEGWQILSAEGEVLSPPQYGDIVEFKNGLAAASRDSRYGLIDDGGNWVVPPEYQQLILLDDAHYMSTDQDGNSRLHRLDETASCALPDETLWLTPARNIPDRYIISRDPSTAADADLTFSGAKLGSDVLGLIDQNCAPTLPTDYFVLEPISEKQIIAAKAVGEKYEPISRPVSPLLPTKKQYTLKYGTIDVTNTIGLPFDFDLLTADPAGRIRALEFSDGNYKSAFPDG